MADFKISQLPLVTEAETGDFVIINKGNTTTSRIGADVLVKELTDGTFLSLAAGAGDQTVQSTGTTTFDGLVEAGEGIRITGTGANTDDIDYGIYKDTLSPTASIRINTNGSRSFCVSETGAVGFPNINDRFRMNIGGEIPAANKDTISISGIEISPTFSVGDYAGVSVFQKSTGGYKGVRIYNTTIDAGAAAYGIYSDLASQADADKFNFYAAKTAPNFLKGNTYIGGDTSRNTFELWRSTLTEEQLEQLEAGTLVAPANVSLPGDGSFVRQWWYDQQDAETQAELDAGTLEYPTHLAAATFTDTFALGDNTKINLLSNGVIKSGIVKNEGVEFINTSSSGSVNSRGIVYSSGKSSLLSVNRPNNDGEDVDVFLARTDNTQYEDDGSRTPINISRGTSFKAESPIGNVSGNYGSYDSYVGFHATAAGDGINNAVWTGDDNSYGVLSSLTAKTGTGGGQTYNFYASGDAPNFLKGNTYIGGDTSRNTFELWRSTLTEEQLEQLTAGTLAIPANVSTPGDGSFVRQWWYDQQSAEDQALIDSGELEYPTHLAAATFTDTFDLGDNTEINLLSNGVIKSTIVQNDGIQFVNNNNTNAIESRGIVYSTANKALLSVNRPNNADEDVEVFLARSDNSEFDADGNRIAVNISRATSFKARNPFGNVGGNYGSYDSYVGFHATDAGDGNTDAVWTGNDDSYGVLSSLTAKTGTGGGQTFNFYAANNAPNYFRGSVTGGGTNSGNAVWSIAADGTTTGITLNGASVLTDEQAGTVETLLDIITDLRARVTALEGN